MVKRLLRRRRQRDSIHRLRSATAKRNRQVIPTSALLVPSLTLGRVYVIVVFTLTMWMGIQKYRHSRNPLVAVLYRDGILYFALIFGGSRVPLIPPPVLDLGSCPHTATSLSYILVLTLGPVSPPPHHSRGPSFLNSDTSTHRRKSTTAS